MKTLKKQWIKFKPRLSRNLNNLKFARTVWMHRFFGLVPYPRFLNIDPYSRCNLKCPFCMTGQKFFREGTQIMTVDLFQLAINKFHHLRNISIVVSGEPFLHKEFLKLVKLAKRKSVSVSTHSHFSFKWDDKQLVEIIESGLDRIYISVDAATAETYDKCRVGGDFDLVFNNMKKLMQLRQKLKSSTPNLIWKFIVNKYNEHELPLARQKALELGVDFTTDALLLDSPALPATFNVPKKNEWLPTEQIHRWAYYNPNPPKGQICSELFERIAVAPDGQVYPCCRPQSRGPSWGNIAQDSLKDIWHSKNYRIARDHFIGKSTNEPLPWPCSACELTKNFEPTSNN